MATSIIAAGTPDPIFPRLWNQTTIRQRTDGYLDATAMARACGKQIHDWLRLESTTAFLDALYAETGYPVSELVQVQRGGAWQGTWVHPRVAVHLAQWCSPEFAVAVSGWVHELLTTGRAFLDDRDSLPVIAREIRDATLATMELTKQLAAGQLATNAKLDVVAATANEARDIAKAALQRVEEIRPRRPISEAVKRKHIAAEHRMGRVCPCCGCQLVTDADGARMLTAEFDHFEGRDKPDVDHTWLVCRDCNQDYLRRPDTRSEARLRFEAYQSRRRGGEHKDKHPTFWSMSA